MLEVTLAGLPHQRAVKERIFCACTVNIPGRVKVSIAEMQRKNRKHRKRAAAGTAAGARAHPAQSGASAPLSTTPEDQRYERTLYLYLDSHFSRDEATYVSCGPYRQQVGHSQTTTCAILYKIGPEPRFLASLSHVQGCLHRRRATLVWQQPWWSDLQTEDCNC